MADDLWIWRPELIANAAERALADEDSRLQKAQAVYGIDAMDEVVLHPVLAAGFETGFGVLREQPYPSQWRRKARGGGEGALPLPRDRERCDLVLTPEPGQVLGDSLWSARRAEVAMREAEGTLFESSVVISAEEGASAAAPGLSPQEAYWLEVKVVAQHTMTSGVLCANSSYASELVRGPTSDLAKLSRDESIVNAGLLLILFAADAATARHDLGEFRRRCAGRALPLGEPILREVSIQDRMGNGVCEVMLVPLLLGMDRG